jgi:Ca2+-binding EF-hand superfamily protein
MDLTITFVEEPLPLRPSLVDLHAEGSPNLMNTSQQSLVDGKTPRHRRQDIDAEGAAQWNVAKDHAESELQNWMEKRTAMSKEEFAYYKIMAESKRLEMTWQEEEEEARQAEESAAREEEEARLAEEVAAREYEEAMEAMAAAEKEEQEAVEAIAAAEREEAEAFEALAAAQKEQEEAVMARKVAEKEAEEAVEAAQASQAADLVAEEARQKAEPLHAEALEAKVVLERKQALAERTRTSLAKELQDVRMAERELQFAQDELDKAGNKQKIRQQFDDLDEDGGGSIDFDEFRALSVSIGLAVNETELKKSFGEIDEDGSGEHPQAPALPAREVPKRRTGGTRDPVSAAGGIDFDEFYGFYSKLYTEEANEAFKKWTISLEAAKEESQECASRSSLALNPGPRALC